MSAAKDFLLRMLTRPFAFAFGVLPLMAGLTTLLGLSLTGDILAALVPDWLLTTLAATYSLSGALLLYGIGSGRVNVEAGGIFLLVSGVLVRLIATMVVLGVSAATVSSAVFYLSVLAGCLVRFWQIVSGVAIITVQGEGD